MEPVQDFVRILLGNDGYFGRNNTRFHIKGQTKTGGTAYADPGCSCP